MGRKPCCEKEGLNRGAWSAREDKVLADYINTHGEGKWRDLPKRAGLNRCGKSCRLRWLNYLRPDIKRGNISGEEEELIVKLHKLLGNRWSLIAGRLPGRTDNEIKNYWNTNLSKRGSDQGVDNNTHHDSTNSKQDTKKSNVTPQHHHVQVIRTKAFKCSKVVFPASHLDCHDGSNAVPGGSDCGSPCSSAAAQPDDEDDDQHDALFGLLRDFDFDVNNMFISGVLSSDFDQQAQINDCDRDTLEGIPKIEDMVMGEQGRLENWRASDDDEPFQPNDHDHPFHQQKDHDDGDGLNAISSFLNIVDDDQWIIS